eukprot:scaffold212549_cov45-Attheya_sp.AAC.2
MHDPLVINISKGLLDLVGYGMPSVQVMSMSKSQEDSQTNTPDVSFSTEKEFQDEDGNEESGGSVLLDVFGSRRDSSYYSAVTEEDELDNPEAESSQTSSYWRRILPTEVVSSRAWHLCNEFLTKKLASDEWHSIKGIHILDGVEAVRLVKFFITSLLFILAYHPLVRAITVSTTGCRSAVAPNNSHVYGAHLSVLVGRAVVSPVFLWGRDPILTCAYGYFVSTNIHCGYMQCFYDQDDDDDGTSGSPDTNTTSYKPFVEADWRNCSASYIP